MGFVHTLTSTDRGFVADTRYSRPNKFTKRRSNKAAILITLGAISMIAIFALAPLGHGSSGVRDSSAGTTAKDPYEFRVYSMNTTTMARLDAGTAFVFTESDLPFVFSSLLFGDFRADTNHSHLYYAGSGMLVSATGASATVRLSEGNGKVISSADYRGQDQIVFNGEVKSVTYPQTTTTYSGTDLMIQDWRTGAWSPENGILVEHPANVTLQSASFYIMTIEPRGTLEIPELPPVMIGATMALMIMIFTITHRRTADKN